MHALLEHFETDHKVLSMRGGLPIQQPQPLTVSTAFDPSEVEPDFDMDLDVDTDTDAASPRTPLHSNRTSPGVVAPPSANGPLPYGPPQIAASTASRAYYPPHTYTYSPTTPTSPYSRPRFDTQGNLHYAVDANQQLQYVQAHYPSVARPSVTRTHSFAEQQSLPSSHSSGVTPQQPLLHPSQVLLVQHPHLNHPLQAPRPIVPPSLFTVPTALAQPFAINSPAPQASSAQMQPRLSDGSISTGSSGNSPVPYDDEDEDAEGEDDEAIEDGDEYGVPTSGYRTPTVSKFGPLSPSRDKSKKMSRPKPSIKKAKKANAGGRKPSDPTREKLPCPRPGCEKVRKLTRNTRTHD